MDPNAPQVSQGYKVATQSPLDDKLVFATIADLSDLSNNRPFTYYEGMLVFCIENFKTYRWKEVASGETGFIAGGYTYPAGSTSFGVDYSTRNFNFVEVDISNGIKSIGSTITIYKGIDPADGKHQIKSVTNKGSASGLDLVTQNTAEDTIEVAKVDSNTLLLSKDPDGTLRIEAEEVDLGGVRDFIVNNKYTGDDELGTEAKPYKTIDAALTAFIGTGDILDPEFNGSSIKVRGSNLAYSFTTNLGINGIKITFDSGAFATYNGTDDYAFDNRPVITHPNMALNGNNKPSRATSFLIEGPGRITVPKGGIYMMGTDNYPTTSGDTNGTSSLRLEEGIYFLGNYDQNNTITNVPETIGGTDYFSVNGLPVTFYQGNSMDFPLVVVEKSNWTSVNISSQTKAIFSTYTQTVFHMKQDGFAWFQGEVDIYHASTLLTLCTLSDDGVNNIIEPTTDYNLVRLDSGLWIADIINTIGYGLSFMESMIYQTQGQQGVYLPQVTIYNGGLIIFTKRNYFFLTESNNMLFNTSRLNDSLGNNIKNFAHGTVPITNIIMNNNSVSRPVSSNVDLTRGNNFATLNFVSNSVNYGLPEFADNASALGVLALGTPYFNTTSNTIDITN